jgi:predicted secreted protein
MHYRFNEKNEELETLKSRILSLEIERQKLQAESLDWRQSYESLESSYQSKLQDLQFHVETQTQQAVETQLAIARNEWYKEKQLLGNELKGAHEKFTVSLSRLLLLDIEVERLNGKLVEYSSHIKQLESHLADVE